MSTVAVWYLQEDTERTAPQTVDQLRERLESGQLSPDAYVQHIKLPTWVPIAAVKGLAEVVAARRAAVETTRPTTTADTPWMITVDGRQDGPMSRADLARRARRGLVDKDTLVWREGMESWVALGSVAALAKVLPGIESITDTGQIRVVDRAQAKARLRKATPRTLDDCRRFLERTPGHEPTLRVLENMVRTGRNALGAVELLEEVLAPRDGWQRLMGIWRNLLRVVRQPDERTNLRMRMGQAAEGPLAVPAQALTIFTSALRESPRRTDVQAALRRLSERLDARAATLQFVDTQADAREGPDRAALARFGGELHLDWQDDVAAAATRFATAARLDPNAATLDRLESLLERLDDWRPWTEALRAAADGVPAEDRVPYLHRLANAWQVRLEKPARALGIYREILQISPDDLQAMDALKRMHRRGIEPAAVHAELSQLFAESRNFKALRDLDVAHLPHSAPGDERAAVLLRLAGLARDQLSDPRAALDYLAQAVAQAPADEKIRAAYVEQAAALGVVEDAVATLEGLQGEHPSLSASLARSLFEVHRERTGNPTAARKWGRIAVNQGAPADRLALLPNLGEHPSVHRLALELLVADPPADWDRNRGRLMLAKTMADDEAPQAIALYRAILADDATHVAALTALAAIYARAEDWDDWFEARQALADGYVDENARIDVWRHSARRAAELARQDDAAELWRRVLSARADDAEALDGLEQANAERGDWDGVADVLERRRAAMDEVDGLWITRRLAEVYAERLDDAARAAACWRAVVRVRPDDADARRSLARLVSGAEAIGLWAALFDADPRDAEAADALAELHRTDGATREAFDVKLRHADSFEDDAEAVARLKAVVAASAQAEIDLGPTPFQRILARTPNDADASDGLARVYGQQEDWTALAASLRERIERATDVPTRQALSRQLAAVQAENLGDPAAAFETLLAVFEAAPDDSLGADLARLAAMSRGWPALLTAWAGAIERVPVSVATPLHRRLARWYMGPQDDPAAAATHLGAVLAQRPDDADAVTALEALFADGRVRGQIIGLLEPVYMRTERQGELVEMLADTLPTGPERVPALRRLGTLYDGLDQGREALDAFGHALEMAPHDADLRADVVRVGQRIKRQDLVADVLGRALLNAERPADVVALGEQLAPLLEGLGQRTRATAVWQRILDADPRNALALAALDAAATARGDLEATCALLARRIEVVDPEGRLELRARLADAWLRRDRVDAAIAVWQSARAEDPGAIEPLAALDELHARGDDWDAVIEVRLARAALAPEDERVALVESLVPIADAHGDADIQLTLRRRLVDVAPTPERIDSLQERLLAEERWADLESLASAQLTTSDDTSRWFATLAQAQSAQGRTLEALESWRQVLDRAPDDVAALEAAYALYIERDEPIGQAQTAVELARALPEDDAERAASLARFAAGHYEQLGQGADAIKAWSQVRALAPDAQDAIDALTRHFTDSGAWARLRDLLRSVLSRARSSDARLALHLQIAELSVERLDDQQAAREAYETALAESPGSPRATVALGRLYQETDDWSAWVELAMARLGDVQHPEARREIYAEAADVLIDRLDSPSHAFALLLKAVIEQPDDVLGPRISALAESLDRFAEAAHAYETALKEARPVHRRGMALRLAEWFEGPLNQPGAAVRAYRSLLSDAPDDAQALRALHRLFEAGHARESIAEELAERHRKAGDWERLHELLAASVPAEPPEARAEAWKQLGAVAADKLDAPQRAMSWYQMALNDAPDDADARGRLLRLGRQLGRLDQVAIALARALPRAETAVRPLGYALADLYDQLGDPEGSERTYELLLTRLGPAESAALAALDARYTAAGRWSELAARLQAAVDAAEDPESKADFAARLARIHEHRLHQGAEAIAAWGTVLAIEPTHDDALASLGRLHQAQQDWAPLFEVYRREAEADPSIRGARYTEMARIATEHLGQPDEAAALWQKSLDAGGDPSVILPALQALHAHAERWPQVVQVIDQRLALKVGVPLPLLQTKARAISKDPSAGDAQAAWQAVLAESPNDLEALRAAWQLDDGTDPAATAALARRLMAAMPADAPERASIARARGRACLSADDPAGARTAWEAVLSSEPSDTEAEVALSTLYGRLDDQAALVALRASQADRAETESERIEAQIALASVQDRAQDAEAASAALDAALAIRPDDTELAERIALMHFAQSRFAEGGAALVRRAAEMEPLDAQAVYIEAANRLRQESQRPSEALDLALAGLALHPRDATMGALIEGLAAESDRWLDAIAAYRTHAIALDGEGQAARLRLASWVAGQVEDEEAAAAEYEAILVQAPENEDAAVKLGVILRKLGRIDRLVALMGMRAEHLPGDAATRLSVEAAQLADEHLDAGARARAWEKVLVSEPLHDKAFRALQAVYRDQENWPALVALLSRRADRVENDTEVTELRLAVADLHAEHLDNEDAAMSAYQRALITDPQNRRALQGVERVLERREDWAELVRFHEGRLAVAPASERHAIYARIAEIQGEKQGDQAAAEGTERVMRQTAGPRARGRSTHALEQVYIESGRWDELAALYERRLKVIPEGAQERSLRTTLANIYAEKLNDSEGAIAVLEPLLDSDDADHAEVRATLDTLLELHEGREDWEGCAEVLKRMARTRRRSKPERIACFMRIGRIYADEMNDPILATQWWREALELDNHHKPAVDAIDGLHARIRREHDLEKARVEREKARIEAERARQAAAARATVKVGSGPITGRVTTDPITGEVTGPIVGAAGLNAHADDPDAGSVLVHAAADDASDDAIPSTAIDPLAVSAPVTRKDEPFRMQVRPDTSAKENPRWMMPLIAIAAFLAVSGAILASVWPRGERLEPAFISFQETVAQAWGDRGDKVAANANPKSPVSSIGPQEVGRDNDEEDVQAESEVIKRTTKITERNLIAIETALASTGLDYEALLTPAGGLNGSPVVDEGHVGGPPIAAPRTWISPLDGPAHVLSPYGPRGREHHSGVDFLAKVGMPVRAIADGEIIFKQSRTSWEKRQKFIERDGKTIKSPAWRAGVYIELRHDDGKVSRYMHLHHIGERLDVGTRVRQRDVIGYVGRTAVEHSDTHLHFELREPVRDSGRYGPSMDPMAVFGAPARENVASAQLLPRIDLGSAPGGAKVRREIEQKLRGLTLLEKMDRLEAVKSLLDQLPLGAPVDNYRLSSTFGNRTDPKSGKPEFHPGVDIPGQLGTVIKATAPGKVVSAGWKGLYGRVVEIDHGNGIRTRYGHLNQTLVRPGQQVTLDDRIGEMGDSGRSSGPHLHYEVLVSDEYEDPLNFLRAGRYIFKR